MVMTVDFLTSYTNRSMETLIEALKKKGLTVNVIGSFDDINASHFLIIWDPLLVPSSSRYVRQHYKVPSALSFKNFNWYFMEDWHILNKIQTRNPGIAYPYLIVPRKKWGLLIPNLKSLINKGKISECLVIPSFRGQNSNSNELERQIIDGETPNDGLKVSSDDGMLIIYPWTNAKRQLFLKKGIISQIYFNDKYYASFKKKVTKITDLVDQKTGHKFRPPFFLERMGWDALKQISSLTHKNENPMIQIDFYPTDQILDWSIGRVKVFAHDDFLSTYPKLANQWSIDVARKFPEYQEKRKKILGLF